MTHPSILQEAAGNPEKEKLNSYPLFDWLRFVLASFVVLAHIGFTPTPLLSGNLAVQVFFALSGWLIGSILLATKLPELPRFFFNRATRIWIPYGFAILLLYGAAALHEGIDFFWLKYLVLDVTFTHQLFTVFPAATLEMPLDGSGNQFWSIAVEEQFYLFAPLVMLFLPYGKTLLIWAPVALVTWLLGWNAASVSLGVCAAILNRDYGLAHSNLARIAALLIAVFLGIAIALETGAYEWLAPPYAICVVLALAWPGKRRPLALIAGGLSFPLYLNHWLALFVMNAAMKRFLPLGEVAGIVATYIFAVVMALGLFWLIDQQVQKRRNSWYTVARGRKLGMIAYGLVGVGLISGALMHRYGRHAMVPANVAEQAP